MKNVLRAALLLLVPGLVGASCKPGVGQPAYLVTDVTLLAIRGEPSEAKPGASVAYTFLLASPTGTVTDAEAIWSICDTPKPPSEGNSVSRACAVAPDAGAGSPGATFTAAIPAKACQLFGPIAPPPTAGQPAVRPRDPDSTGGYYLPVQLWLPSLPNGPLSGFAFERITCNLANAPSTAIADYNSRYLPNQEPAIERTDLVDEVGVRRPLDAAPQTVTVGNTVTVEASFAAGAAEVFPVFDPVAQELVDQQESLSLSWFVTAGSFQYERTGVAPGEPATASGNRWTAPVQPGTVHFWLVLRDVRGGTTYKSYDLQVVP